MMLYVMKPDPAKKDAIAREMIEKGYICQKPSRSSPSLILFLLTLVRTGTACKSYALGAVAL
jgi:hypothetical protein